jgi:tripartite-type tricarboxylate transporter receptor subunit TctC
MRKHMMLQAACAFAIAACAATTKADARDADVAQFFKGKQVTLYIANAVGGGYDTYARLIARYLGSYIPGNPSIVPVNMPGAGGAVLMSYLLTSAARDGAAIAALEPGAITGPLFADQKRARYDSRKFVYLGSANSEVYGCWARADAQVKSYPEAFSKELVVGGSSAGDSTVDLPTVEKNVLGTKFKVISGYAGSNDVLLAMDRNEVQGICGLGLPPMLTQRPAWVASGFVKMLDQENVAGSPILNKEGVPRAPDFAKTDEQRKVLGLIFSQQKFGRPYAMPPGAPRERVAALRQAFMQVLQDKGLLADAQKRHLDIQALPGGELGALIDEIYETPPAIASRATQALGYGATQRK